MGRRSAKQKGTTAEEPRAADRDMRPGPPVANDCTIFAARRSGTVAQIAVLSFEEGGAPRYENTGREERDNLNRSIPRSRPPRRALDSD
jgi:hypothetical protein